MRYVVTLASGKKEEIVFPLTYYETPTGVYERVHAEWSGEMTPESLLKLFSIITGKDYTEYRDSTDLRIEAMMLEAVGFVVNNPVDLQAIPKPKFFKIDGRVLELPEYEVKYKKFTLGQLLLIRRVGMMKDIRAGISLAVAVYIQPLLDGKFDDERVDYYKELVKQLPITDTFPIGFFILRRANNLGNGLIDYLRLIWQITRNSMLAAVSLVKHVSRSCFSPIMKYRMSERIAIFFQP